MAFLMSEGNRMAVIDEDGRHPFDIVIAGSLQFVNGGRAWACLVGDRARRELFVVVNGERIGRSFDWSEITRQIRQDASAAVIRSWVAAEVEWSRRR